MIKIEIYFDFVLPLETIYPASEPSSYHYLNYLIMNYLYIFYIIYISSSKYFHLFI